MTPKRIQRRRVKGWKMPPNTVYVGRPTIFGNPYLVNPGGFTREQAVELFRRFMAKTRTGFIRKRLGELRGKNLACWCPLSQPCHADVLLEIANSWTRGIFAEEGVMTDRSSEERSRVNDALSKISAIALRGLPPKTGYIFYVDEVRQVIEELLRAALEDRQEAAPEVAEAFEKAAVRVELEIRRYPEYRRILQRAADLVRETAKFWDGGVPSEATPSKKGPCPFASNSPWFQQHPELCRRCSGDGTVMVGGHSQELQDAVRSVCLHCEGTGKEPCADQSPAPAPEVQKCFFCGGTGAIKSHPNALSKSCDICKGSGFAPEVQGTPTSVMRDPFDAGFQAAIERGTPQKETPTSISAESASPLQLAQETANNPLRERSPAPPSAAPADANGKA